MKDTDTFGDQGRFSYCIHNIVGHPIAEVFWVLGLEKVVDYVHDITDPYPDTKV